MDKNIKYFILPRSLTVIIDSKSYHISSNNDRYNEAIALIKENNLDHLINLVDPTINLGLKDFSIEHGLVKYKNIELPSLLGDKLNQFPKESYLSLVNFYINLIKRNDFEKSKQNVLEMLNKDGYPLTEDGFIIVYNGYDLKWYDEAMNKDKTVPFYSYSGCIREVKDLLQKKKNLESICLEIFGFFSKKLNKIVLDRSIHTKSLKFNSDVFKYGIIFKTLLNKDKILFLIDNNIFFDSIKSLGEEDCIILKDFLTKFNEEKIYNFFIKAKDVDQEKISLNQLVSSYKFLKDKKVEITNEDFKNIKSFKEACDFLKKETFKLNNPIVDLRIKENFNFLYKIKDLKLNDDLEVIIPEDNIVLWEWSKKMSNCIFSYTNRIVKGECFVLGVYSRKLDKIIYNIEIFDYKINQFVKKLNNPVDSNSLDYRLVFDFLKNNKIIK